MYNIGKTQTEEILENMTYERQHCSVLMTTSTQPTQKLCDVITQVRALDTFSHVSADKETEHTAPSSQLNSLLYVCEPDSWVNTTFVRRTHMHRYSF